MLDDIRRLFRQSVQAFRDELSHRDPEDQVAELLTAMRKELVATRAAIPEGEAHLARVRADLERERELLAQCERRRDLAKRIHDRETVQVAEEFAARHRDRVGVFEQKVAAAEADLELLRREAAAMKARYQEADANRFALLAQLRMAGTRERMRSALGDEIGPFADLERMRQTVEDRAGYADALRELDGSPPPPVDREGERLRVEKRLEELKRRMGRE
jgi:phage shock protein A